MGRYHVQRALRAAGLSELEGSALLAGLVLIITGAIAAVLLWDTGGIPRGIGLAGLAALVACGASRAVRLYRAGMAASLPSSVGRTQVRIRPAHGFGVSAVALALVLPLATGVAVLVLVDWAWLLIAGVLLLGCTAMVVTWAREVGGDRHYSMSSATASGLLERLCMRADMPAPELVVEHCAVANAWTAGGRLHVSRSLLRLLDDRELEAVLAHEVAHLARRDATVMEICSAPSRVLLAFAGFLTPRLPGWTRNLAVSGSLGIPVALWFLALLCIPPAFVVGWISRLSVLGMSRAREFSADAAAAALTGRPSALASALLKLERQSEWAPRVDLRQVEAYAVLCIVGARRSRLGRVFSTHPPTATRVKRLEAIETRLR